MRSYACGQCGWIFTPDVADPEGGVNEGTMFDEVSSAWSCPECGAKKQDFAPVDE